MTWREFVEKNNPGLFNITSPPGSPSGSPRTSPIPSDADHDLELAIDLLEKLLIPESIHRITARDALYHPFLAEFDVDAAAVNTEKDRLGVCESAKLGDDSFFPHPIGEGCCASYHDIDEETGEHTVHIPPVGAQKRGEMRIVQPGQGMAIGFRACEFHAQLEQFRDEAEATAAEGEGAGEGVDDRDDLSEEL